MGRNIWGVVTGLLVLAAGLVVVSGVIRSDEPAAVESMSVTTTDFSPPAAPPVSTTLPEPELPGVASAVTRVLDRAGNVGYARRRDLSQLPPSVSNLLAEYGVVLRVPEKKGNGK